MTAKYLGVYEPMTPEWLALRKDKVGGSEIAAILGLSPYQSAYALWHQKRGEIDLREDKPQLEWGTRLEPVIVQAWADKHPEVEVDYAPAATYAHPERPYQTVAPDALVYDLDDHSRVLTGVEAKTSRYDYSWSTDGEPCVPDYYNVQAQWAMDVFGVDVWHFAVLFGGSDYREYQIEGRASVQEALRETASDFLDSIREGRVPPADGHESTYNAVRELHPDLLIDERVDVGDVGRRWVQTKRDLAAAEEAEREAKALLAIELGNCHRAFVGDVQVAYRKNTGKGRPPTLTAVNGLLAQDVA